MQRKHFLSACIATCLMFLSQISLAALPANVTESLSPMLKRLMPAVVHIQAQGKVPVIQQAENEADEDQPAAPQFGNRKFSSVGSGVIVDAKNGYVMTNAHVIKHADTITATLSSGHTYPAKLIGSDPASDIALLQITAKNLTALELVDSDQLEVGDVVAAIGSPFGLNQTVTSGIVSALSRSGLGIEGYEDFIQTDASINPGNSGGALVNMKGELVGINTAILAANGSNGSVGIGFAIPANMARTVMEQLIKHGEVKRGLLGILVQPLNPELAQALNVEDHDFGAVISQVSPGSPADKAGVRPGDVVVSVNSKEIKSAPQVRNIIGLLRVGTQVQLTFLRQGKAMSVQTRTADPNEFLKASEAENKFLFGLKLANFNEVIPGQGQIEGVAIMGLAENTASYKSGLRPGDIILFADNEPVKDINAFREVTNGAKEKLLVNVLRANGAMFIVVS